MLKNLKVCELCGKLSDNLMEAVVEGAILSVCKTCSEFGNVIPIKKPIQSEISKGKIVIEREPEEFEIIVQDYAQKVKQSREDMQLKQEELAQKLAEKVSVIHHIEIGHLKPSLLLAKKLENFFHIKLIEKYKEEKTKTIYFADSGLTIGDLAKFKK